MLKVKNIINYKPKIKKNINRYSKYLKSVRYFLCICKEIAECKFFFQKLVFKMYLMANKTF